MATKINYCRLCLQISTTFEPLTSSKAKMLKLISLDIDLALTDKPVICSKCLGVLQQSYDFKTTYLKNEAYLKTLDCESDVTLTLEKLIPRNTMERELKCEDDQVCRFCLKYSDRSCFVKLNIEDDIFLKNMLQKCLSEIELSTTNRPLICNDCMENLQNQFNFVTACSDNDDAIRKYISISDGTVDLGEVSKHIRHAEADLDYVKVENVSKNFDGISCDVMVKEEKVEPIEEDELHIKPEDENDSKIETDRDPRADALKLFQCEHCLFRTKYKNRIKSHTMIIHKKDSAIIFKCDRCDFKTYQKDNLQRHLRKHEGNAPFGCDRCSKLFLQKIQLYRHILKNHKEMQHVIESKIYRCDSCNYSTLNSTDLNRHVSHKHSRSTAQKYHCDKCEFSCLQKSGLRTHLYTHTTDKPMVCTECQKGFTQKRQLDSHILYNHSWNTELLKTITYKVIRCDVCPYRTIGSFNLKKHMKVHTVAT